MKKVDFELRDPWGGRWGCEVEGERGGRVEQGVCNI